MRRTTARGLSAPGTDVRYLHRQGSSLRPAGSVIVRCFPAAGLWARAIVMVGAAFMAGGAVAQPAAADVPEPDATAQPNPTAAARPNPTAATSAAARPYPTAAASAAARPYPTAAASAAAQ